LDGLLQPIVFKLQVPSSLAVSPANLMPKDTDNEDNPDLVPEDTVNKDEDVVPDEPAKLKDTIDLPESTEMDKSREDEPTPSASTSSAFVHVKGKATTDLSLPEQSNMPFGAFKSSAISSQFSSPVRPIHRLQYMPRQSPISSVSSPTEFRNAMNTVIRGIGANPDHIFSSVTPVPQVITRPSVPNPILSQTVVPTASSSVPPLSARLSTAPNPVSCTCNQPVFVEVMCILIDHFRCLLLFRTRY
jgi:hypothetical protein